MDYLLVSKVTALAAICDCLCISTESKVVICAHIHLFPCMCLKYRDDPKQNTHWMFYDSELYDSYGFVMVWMEMNMVVSKKKNLYNSN